MYIIMPSKSKTRRIKRRQCGGYVYSKSRSTKSNLKSKSQYKNRSNKLKNKTKSYTKS